MGDNTNRGGRTSVPLTVSRTSSVFPRSQLTRRDGISGAGGATAGSRTITISTGGLGGASSNWQDQIPEGYEVVSKNGNRVTIRPIPGSATERAAIATAQQQNGAGLMQGPIAGEANMTALEQRSYREQQIARAERTARAQQSQANYRQQVEQSRIANQVVLDGYRTGGGATPAEGTRPGDYTVNADGQLVDSAGNPVSGASYNQRVARQTAAATSTFSSLNPSGILPSSQFVLSYGERLDAATGNERTSGNQDLRVGGRNASQTTLTERGGPVQNVVSIQTGLRWFQQLAQRDKGAYNALIVQLRNAGYLGNLDDAELPLGTYTRQAGQAFAEAAADLSDNFQVGETTALLPWLQQRGQAYADALAEADAEAAAEAEYKPVDRSFTDPEAVRQAAKEAAIEALGRKLTDEEEARFQAAFRGKENGYYDAIDSAGRAKTAASVADPNLGAQAQAFVEDDQYDTERATQQVGQYAQVFQRMMGL